MFGYSQKAVRVTTLMKRLRANEQGDSGASGTDGGAPSGTSAAPVAAGGGLGLAASLKAALSANAPDTQTPATPTEPQLSTATVEEKPEERCNGDVL